MWHHKGLISGTVCPNTSMELGFGKVTLKWYKKKNALCFQAEEVKDIVSLEVAQKCGKTLRFNGICIFWPYLNCPRAFCFVNRRHACFLSSHVLRACVSVHGPCGRGTAPACAVPSVVFSQRNTHHGAAKRQGHSQSRERRESGAAETVFNAHEGHRLSINHLDVHSRGHGGNSENRKNAQNETTEVSSQMLLTLSLVFLIFFFCNQTVEIYIFLHFPLYSHSFKCTFF